MAEPTSSALGPRYAPDDPTLPKPWKGLIDGSTGLSYYWNPETNVTQYEKPVAPTPTMPLAPIPGGPSVLSNGITSQIGQQISQGFQQESQQMSHLSQHPYPVAQQHSSMAVQASHQEGMQITQALQHHGLQSSQTMHQPGQLQQHKQHMMHYQGTQTLPNTNQHMSQPPNLLALQHPGQIIPQHAAPQIPHNISPSRGLPMVQHQGQYAHQQFQYMAYQPNAVPKIQQNSQQQLHHTVQGQPFANQLEYMTKNSKKEEDDFQHGNQVVFSPSQFQQTGISSTNNVNVGTNSIPMQKFGGPSGQAPQFGVPPAGVQQTPPVPHLQAGSDFRPQHLTKFQNQMNPALMHGQQAGVPPNDMKMEKEENISGRVGNEYYGSSNKEGPAASMLQPKLATIPMGRSHHEMGTSAVPFQNTRLGQSSGLNAVAGYSLQNVYNQGMGGQPLSNNAQLRLPIGSSDVTNMSPVESYCKQHEVTTTGDNVPAPFMTFEATGFPPEVLKEIYSAGFSSPTPIQAQTWPIALQGRDILAIAKTGSGKTLGYLIPAFILLRQRRNNPQNGPTVLVLSPTRELATQIQDEAIKFGRSSRVSCTCLYGGAPKGPQLKELERGADIVVATPGRLNDILEMKMINFRQISLLVLDEADRMLDMGFEPQIRKIVNEIPPRRQTLMYTATWPKEVRKIAGDLLVNPVQVNIGSVDELAANKAITQFVEIVPQMEKQNRLEQILRSQERGSKVIIFCSTKRLCDHLARSLGRSFGAAAIHGDKSQGERDWVLNQFRNGKSPILVATDVAARGLDIKDIRVVINYDFPTGIEDYVHRIGRTGRAGATGVSYTFFSDQDWKYAADLIKLLEGANQQVPPEVREMAMRGGPSFGKDRGGMNRFDPSSGGGRWDSTGHGRMRDGSFGRGRGGMRDAGFSGRGGMRDGDFSGHGGMREGFGDRGGRNDFFTGRGNRGRGFGGPMGGGGWGRNDNSGPNNRYNTIDGRGRSRGRGQGRFNNRRDMSDRSRGRSYSRSPERVRTWGYSRSRSSSRSSRSRSWSRSRSRSWSRSRSRSRSWSRGHSRKYSRSRSRSPSLERPRAQNANKENSKSPKHGTTSESSMFSKPPVKNVNTVLETSDVGQQPVIESAAPGYENSAVDGAETVVSP